MIHDHLLRHRVITTQAKGSGYNRICLTKSLLKKKEFIKCQMEEARLRSQSTAIPGKEAVSEEEMAREEEEEEEVEVD